MLPIFFIKHSQIHFCFSLAPSIKLMTHSESHHTNYSLLKKKCCLEVNRQRNTNNILLTLLFTIKRCLSISLKSRSKWNIQLVLWVLWVVLRGATSCYEVLHVIFQELRCTTRQFELLQVVLRDTARYYESLWGTTSGTRRYYKVIQVVLEITMWYYERSKVQRVIFERDSPKDRQNLWNFMKLMEKQLW